MTPSAAKHLENANGHGSPAEPPAAIAVEKIVKKYGDFEAVKGVTFDVPDDIQLGADVDFAVATSR